MNPGLCLDSGEFIPAAQLNSAKTVAVDRGYHWVPIDRHTPRGVKLQLISRPAGVATYGVYSGDPHWTHYAPLPTFFCKSLDSPKKT